jgi:hypothetical protein
MLSFHLWLSPLWMFRLQLFMHFSSLACVLQITPISLYPWYGHTLIMFNIVTCMGCAWLIRRFWIVRLDLLTPYSHITGLQVIRRYRWTTHLTVHCYTLTRVLSLHQSLQITHEIFFGPPNFFLAVILHLPIPKILLNSIPLNVLYNRFARTTKKTQPLYCWECVHCNGSYSIVACILVAAGMCLPSHT